MLLAVTIARARSHEEAEAEIVGTVTLGTDEEGEARPGSGCADPERVLREFVPTATACTATDEGGELLVFAGEVEERGDERFRFEIRVSVADRFRLGFRAASELDDGRELAWDAEVDPEVVAVEAGRTEVGDVTYTVTGMSCDATTA